MLESTLCERISKVTQLQRRWSGWEESVFQKPLHRSTKPATLHQRPRSALGARSGTPSHSNLQNFSSQIHPIDLPNPSEKICEETIFSNYGLSRFEVSNLHALADAVNRLLEPSATNFHNGNPAAVCILESLAVILDEHCILGPLLRSICAVNFSRIFLDPLPFLTPAERRSVHDTCDSSITWITWIHKRAAQWNRCVSLTTFNARIVEAPAKRRSIVKKDEPVPLSHYINLQKRLDTNRLALHFRAWRADVRTRKSVEKFSMICLRSCSKSVGPLQVAFQQWKSFIAKSLTARFRGHFDRLQFVQDQDSSRLQQLSQSLHDTKRRLLLAEMEVTSLRDTLSLRSNALSNLITSPAVVDFRHPIFSVEISEKGNLLQSLEPISEGTIHFTTKKREKFPLSAKDPRLVELCNTSCFDVGREQKIDGVATPHHEEFSSFYSIRVEPRHASATDTLTWLNTITSSFCRENFSVLLAASESASTLAVAPMSSLSCRVRDSVEGIERLFHRFEQENGLLRLVHARSNSVAVAPQTALFDCEATEICTRPEMFLLSLAAAFPNRVRAALGQPTRTNRSSKMTEIEWRSFVPWFNELAQNSEGSRKSLQQLFPGEHFPPQDTFTVEHHALQFLTSLRAKFLLDALSNTP